VRLKLQDDIREELFWVINMWACGIYLIIPDATGKFYRQDDLRNHYNTQSSLI
jgi:hypothetical protein